MFESDHIVAAEVEDCVFFLFLKCHPLLRGIHLELLSISDMLVWLDNSYCPSKKCTGCLYF